LFFISDQQIVNNDKVFKKYLWIPITVIHIIIALFFLIFVIRSFFVER